MGKYQEVKEVYNDIKKDKTMMLIFKILGFIVILIMLIITYKAIFEPVNLWGLELNKNKVQHDTIYKTVTIRDTVKIILPQKAANVQKTQEVKADVKSIDQKGGQTANQINNN